MCEETNMNERKKGDSVSVVFVEHSTFATFSDEPDDCGNELELNSMRKEVFAMGKIVSQDNKWLVLQSYGGHYSNEKGFFIMIYKPTIQYINQILFK